MELHSFWATVLLSSVQRRHCVRLMGLIYRQIDWRALVPAARMPLSDISAIE